MAPRVLGFRRGGSSLPPRQSRNRSRRLRGGARRNASSAGYSLLALRRAPRAHPANRVCVLPLRSLLAVPSQARPNFEERLCSFPLRAPAFGGIA